MYQHRQILSGCICSLIGGNLHWFNFQWPDHLKEWSIEVKELFPVVITAALHRPQWREKIVQFVVDNLAVVQVLNSTYKSNNHVMHLIAY